jgi:glycosyltransferase involved in cell wall biosynthesis
MRLHLVALPHTQVSSAFCGCAYTSKVRLFCKMMQHDFAIRLYAPEGPEVEGAELVPCLSQEERISTFGPDDCGRLPAWPTDKQAESFNREVLKVLKPEPNDLVLLCGGWTHQAIAQTVSIPVEPFVGYEGILPRSFCAFESYAWMHTVYAKKQINDVRWFDTVIPPYFDPSEFTSSETRSDHLLFLGRVIQRKGFAAAAAIAEATGRRLIVAGPGGKIVKGRLIGSDVDISANNLTYLGPVNTQERKRLLSEAYALLMPTTYAEPGGNVAIEAMASGTPVICTDFGIFPETVINGISGFRFRMLREAVQAIKMVEHMDRSVIRAHARQFSLPMVAPRFKHWFTNLMTLHQKGWYAE